ncbi:MAG: HAD family hydrolase [Candidatus Brocadiaceae bacterium]|nr:HAD family hydrolase [Candidatus Brocadiaceae bacterium]
MPKILKNIKTIILDLDDTLYDCSGTLVLRKMKQVAKSLSREICCSEEEAYRLQVETEELFGTKMNIYAKIAERYNLSPEYVEVLLKEFVHMDVSHIVPFRDTPGTLLQLKSLGYVLILVTFGEQRIQKKKIEVLGLDEDYFDEIIISDGKDGQTKKNSFRNILCRHKLNPNEIVCVGDKIEDELVAGKSLGMVTVLLKHGRHYHDYLKRRGEGCIKPDYSIKNIKDLMKLLSSIDV